ncbi:MAG: hypothetical protein BLM47_06190 [Candidatus Reconcilbacillus cellulovorans]|uniref:Putative amidase domain-containing protein n=1 Tax=Candidatus Reconcilbacillus cellulovorans TaxID=1906605 RepID=A0A2A6E1J2_9BACL|nr:MAG: hypothetical protein BLM47_06190 [Candidatus Reconcilbacillus cellulovorans]
MARTKPKEEVRAFYDRRRAAEYAELWWNRRNPAYTAMEVNCTNFVSQCLFAGGAPMHYTGNRNTGWWYVGRVGGAERWSYSWAVADSLLRYLEQSRTGLRGIRVASPEELDVGDVIFYDWNGDGRFQHSAVVTTRDGFGRPLVNANTSDSRHRFWAYRDSPAWTERTAYAFVRISDTF